MCRCFRKFRVPTLLLGILLAFPGCALLPRPPQAMTLLTLEVPAAAPAPKIRKGNPVLQIAPVAAVTALQGSDFLYRRGGPVVHRFARHRWLAPPAELIDQALMEHLAPRLPFTVVRPGQGVMPPATLNLTLLRLEQVFTGEGSEIHLVLQAQLVDRDRGRVVGTRLFRYRQPAPEASPRGGAEAAGIALGRFFTELRRWLVAYREQGSFHSISSSTSSPPGRAYQ